MTQEKIRLLPKLMELGACAPALYTIQDLNAPTVEATAAHIRTNHFNWWGWLESALEVDRPQSTRSLIKKVQEADLIDVDVATHFYIGVDVSCAYIPGIRPALDQWEKAAADYCPFARPTECTVRVLVNYLEKHDPTNYTILRTWLDRQRRVHFGQTAVVSDDYVLYEAQALCLPYAIELGSVLLQEDAFSHLCQAYSHYHLK